MSGPCAVPGAAQDPIGAGGSAFAPSRTEATRPYGRVTEWLPGPSGTISDPSRSRTARDPVGTASSTDIRPSEISHEIATMP